MSASNTGSASRTHAHWPRVVALAVGVAFVEWSLAPPAEIARDPERAPLPFAILAVLVPIGLAAWAMSLVRQGRPASLRLDLLRAVLFGSLAYVAVSLCYRLIGD